MNRNDKFERLIKEITLISDEIKKNWRSESADLFCNAFDDSVKYIKKVTENCRENSESDEEKKSSPLSDFSF